MKERRFHSLMISSLWSQIKRGAEAPFGLTGDIVFYRIVTYFCKRLFGLFGIVLAILPCSINGFKYYLTVFLSFTPSAISCMFFAVTQIANILFSTDILT